MYRYKNKRIAVNIKIINAILIYDKKKIYIKLFNTSERCREQNGIIDRIRIYKC